jgi:hypothetical protein
MIVSTQITGAPQSTNIFFASTGSQYAVTTIILCNTSASATAQVNVYAQSFAGGGAIGATGSLGIGTSTCILNAITLPPTETFVMDTEKFILESNDRLDAQEVSGNGGIVTCTVSAIATS